MVIQCISATNLGTLISAASSAGPVAYVIPVLVEPNSIFYCLKYSQFVFKYKRLQLIVLT